jgi:HNH endonuclease
MRKPRTRRSYSRAFARNCERSWSIPERLTYYSKPDPLGGCHLWQGNLKDGYGCLRLGGKLHFAHRLAWEARHGPIPEGLVLRHRCNVRRCCNADHLVPGTRAENNADQKRANLRIADARATTARGLPGSDPDLAPIRIFVHGVEMKGGVTIRLVDPDLAPAARRPTPAPARSRASRAAWRRSAGGRRD